MENPICEALRGKGAPDTDAKDARISVEELPRCRGCGGLLRPDVVWFGESLSGAILQAAFEALESCDLCLIVGTSSVVYPAAMMAPSVAARGVPVAEFNLECTPNTEKFAKNGFYFEGKCGEILPVALAPPLGLAGLRRQGRPSTSPPTTARPHPSSTPTTQNPRRGH